MPGVAGPGMLRFGGSSSGFRGAQNFTPSIVAEQIAMDAEKIALDRLFAANQTLARAELALLEAKGAAYMSGFGFYEREAAKAIVRIRAAQLGAADAEAAVARSLYRKAAEASTGYLW
jgi:hypothetical protein